MGSGRSSRSVRHSPLHVHTQHLKYNVLPQKLLQFYIAQQNNVSLWRGEIFHTHWKASFLSNSGVLSQKSKYGKRYNIVFLGKLRSIQITINYFGPIQTVGNWSANLSEMFSLCVLYILHKKFFFMLKKFILNCWQLWDRPIHFGNWRRNKFFDKFIAPRFEHNVLWRNKGPPPLHWSTAR